VLEVVNFLKEKNLTEFMISIVVILVAAAFFILIVIIANRKDANGYEKPLGVIYKSSLSPEELFILIFYKKDCPYCGLKLKRKKEITKINEGIEKISHTYLYGDIYNKKIFFRCENCNKNFNINELGVVSKQKEI
jgi:thioredoxin-related protein